MLIKTIESLSVDKVEKIKLRIEYFKAWGTIISIMASLLAVVCTIVVNMILQAERAETDFELKAVEIVMTADTPQEAVNKAIVLRELFPDRLSSHFLETLKKLYEENDNSISRSNIRRR